MEKQLVLAKTFLKEGFEVKCKNARLSKPMYSS